MRKHILMAGIAGMALGLCSMSAEGAEDDAGGGGAPEPTFGEKAVVLTFNPGGREDVEACKRGFAAEIDRMHALRIEASAASDSEKARLASVAITELQAAQMWAVKALTWAS